jgi:arsenate reductase (thioredoxin)
MRPRKPDMRRILFLCTGNSCRSQIAEGFGRIMIPNGNEVYSAGIAPVGIHPLTVQVMKEAGLDLHSQKSKGLSSIPLDKISTVITLCGHAEEHCPTFPANVERHHWPIKDPVRVRGTDEEVLRAFRMAREEIRNCVKEYMEKIKNG